VQPPVIVKRKPIDHLDAGLTAARRGGAHDRQQLADCRTYDLCRKTFGLTVRAFQTGGITALLDSAEASGNTLRDADVFGREFAHPVRSARVAPEFGKSVHQLPLIPADVLKKHRVHELLDTQTRGLRC
jgi:hypothetical protein